MITVLPEGGLCNRLRVVASAWSLACATGHGMKVLWYRTPDFNSRFDTLFVTAHVPFLVLEGRAWSRGSRALFHVREVIASAGGSVVVRHAQTEVPGFDARRTIEAAGRRSVHIRTNSRLVDMPGMFDIFQPVAAVKGLLDDMTDNLSQSVGVHVRHSDNVKAAAESTLDCFVELMEAEVRSNPKTRFFVATDSPEAWHRLHQSFSGRVWQHTKRSYSRNDARAIVDATIDLFALSRCSKLIGSYWSSFTDTAAAMNNIPLVIARRAG